jgi:uncharacterized protein
MILEIWHILLELAPWLLIGALIAGVLHAIVPADFLQRHLTGRWSVVKSAAIGVPMPLCSCSVIPVGLSLRRQGASPGATVAFLISTPETGVDSIFVSAGFFGWPFALFKWASAFVIGLTGGVLTDRFAGDPPIRSEAGSNACVEPEHRGLRGVLPYSIELLRSLWGWLAFGVVVSAAIGYFLPADGLAAFNAYGGAAAMLIALIIGMPLYVCALASVPIAAALVQAGFPPGAALVFLIAGPATNLATMGAVYRVLGKRTLGIYLATIAIGSIACGLLFDGLIENPTIGESGHEHHTPAWWAVASVIILLALVARFAWEDAARWLHSRAARRGAQNFDNVATPAARVEVPVLGMTCNNCVAKLERVIGREAGVSGVEVTLQPGRAIVLGKISEPRVRELVSQAGFQPG